MKQQLPVYIDRLREGRTETIDETIDPKQLELSDDEISCTKPLRVSGEAYLVEDYLVIVLSIQAEVSLACRLCNERFPFSISIASAHEEVALSEIKDACFDLQPLIRELVLLEIPLYPQCAGTSCKNRQNVECFLKKPDEHVHTPFKDLL